MDLGSYLESIFDLSNLVLSKSYYYKSLSFCVIDAVYSIGVRYSSTINTVVRYSEWSHRDLYREYGTGSDSIENEYSISEFYDDIKSFSSEKLAEEIFNNKQRTSSVNGILKAQAVREFTEILIANNINYFSDVNKMIGNQFIEDQILKIKGQGSGTSLMYFYMLAGDDNKIKTDRHILRFFERYKGSKVTSGEAIQMVNDVVKKLKSKYPNLTSRSLDHAIWKYESIK